MPTPASIILRMNSSDRAWYFAVIGAIMLLMFTHLHAWFKFVFLERVSFWWPKSKKKKVWARKVNKKPMANKMKKPRESDDCNHGLRLDLYNPDAGRGCVALVRRWLSPYSQVYQYAVWGSSESFDWLASYYLMAATRHFLNGSIKMAAFEASFAYIYEQHKMARLSNTTPEIDWHQFGRIRFANKPTLAAHLRERIPCKCLD